jgi:hypothetical protein
MHETFCSGVEGEEEGQRRLMEEFAGAEIQGGSSSVKALTGSTEEEQFH